MLKKHFNRIESKTAKYCLTAAILTTIVLTPDLAAFAAPISDNEVRLEQARIIHERQTKELEKPNIGIATDIYSTKQRETDTTEVAVGWLEDTDGNVVTNPKVIKKQLPAFSYGASVSVGLGKSRYSNLDGYKFYTQLLNPNANLSFGISWTKYLGTKDDVAKGVIK